MYLRGGCGTQRCFAALSTYVLPDLKWRDVVVKPGQNGPVREEEGVAHAGQFLPLGFSFPRSARLPAGFGGKNPDARGNELVVGIREQGLGALHPQASLFGDFTPQGLLGAFPGPAYSAGKVPSQPVAAMMQQEARSVMDHPHRAG